MEIKSDIFDIHETGSVISINNKPIDFIFSNIVFRFTFKDDLSNSAQHVIAENIMGEEKGGINLIFTNYNNSTGSGNKEPLKMGWIKNRILYLNYRIYALQPNIDKLIHFTWYLGEVKND